MVKVESVLSAAEIQKAVHSIAKRLRATFHLSKEDALGLAGVGVSLCAYTFKHRRGSGLMKDKFERHVYVKGYFNAIDEGRSTHLISRFGKPTRDMLRNTVRYHDVLLWDAFCGGYIMPCEPAIAGDEKNIENRDFLIYVKHLTRDLCDARVIDCLYSRGLTLKSTADLVGLSESRISQIRSEIVRRVKQSIKGRRVR